MAKQYNLHSVRIEDDVWARIKVSGKSVNQLLLIVLSDSSETLDGDAVVRYAQLESPKRERLPPRMPLLKPSQK